MLVSSVIEFYIPLPPSKGEFLASDFGLRSSVAVKTNWHPEPGTRKNKFFAGMNVISNFVSDFLNRIIPLVFKIRNGLIIDSDLIDQRFN